MKLKTMFFALLSIVCLVSSVCVFVVGVSGETDATSTGVGLELVVNYADGSSSDPYVQSSLFSLVPATFSLVDEEGKDIESFAVAMDSSLKTSGVVSNWTVVGSIQTEVYKGTETVPKTSATYEFDESGVVWADGETKELKSFTLPWSVVEAALVDWGDGAWSIQFVGCADVYVGFESGNEDVSDAEASISMKFKYVESGISDFSLNVKNDVTTLSLANQVEGVGLPGWTPLVLLVMATVVCACGAVYFYKTEVD